MRDMQIKKHYYSYRLMTTCLTRRYSIPRLRCKLQQDFSTLPLYQIQTRIAPTPWLSTNHISAFLVAILGVLCSLYRIPFSLFSPFFNRMKISVRDCPYWEPISSHPSSHSNCLFICNFPPFHYFSPCIHFPFQKPNLFKTIGIPL